MIEYIEEMVHKKELQKKAEIYGYDIIYEKDGYISIPDISENVVFTYIAGTVGVWNPKAFESLVQEIESLPDSRSKRLLVGETLSKAYFATLSEKGYEFCDWFRNVSGCDSTRFYLVPIGEGDCYCLL